MLDWCLKFPPIETEESPWPEEATLRINKALHLGKYGPRVVSCAVDGWSDESYVAKIYDPLFYDDPFNYEVHYSNEAACYEDIWEGGYEGTYTPKFYGTWTCDLPIDDPTSVQKTRPVRMVLLEEIRGITIYTIIDNDLTFSVPPVERLNLMAKILELDSKLEYIGVRNQDLAPRNILLEGWDLDMLREWLNSEGSYKVPRVVLFDFNHALAFDRPYCHEGRIPVPKPLNPIYKWWRSCPLEFRAWVPRPYCLHHRRKAWKGWMKSVFYKSAEYSSYREVGLDDYWREDYEETDEVETVPPEPDHPEGWLSHDQSVDGNGSV
jgi:serine/threonine protein kinase